MRKQPCKWFREAVCNAEVDPFYISDNLNGHANTQNDRYAKADYPSPVHVEPLRDDD